MFKRGIKLKKLIEVLRLSQEKKLSEREISKLVGIAKTTVHNYLVLFRNSGLAWPLPAEFMDDEILSKKLNSEYQGVEDKLDFIKIHHELKSHKHMTLQLIWEEYQLNKEMPYCYAHFAKLYKQWRDSQPSSMRQKHKAGEKVFIDYSGDRVPLYDNEDNIKSYAEIFVAVLGCSSLIYLEATHSQKLSDRIMSHVRLFNYLGGVPELVVTDNLKSGVKKSHRYDPEITPAYYEMLRHYNTAAMPARVYTPRDKAKAENGVLIIQRWILARLRKCKFTSLFELNQELSKLMNIANNKKLQGYPYTRQQLFNELDKPALLSLPLSQYSYREYKKVRIGNDYHFRLQGHYYSVPYTLVNEEIDVWYNSTTIECYHRGQCVAKHIRSTQVMESSTIKEHMPISHQKYAEMTVEEAQRLANQIGIATALVVEHIITQAEHPTIGCRRSYGFLRLAKKYSGASLENACNYAINIGVYDYKNIQILLERNVVPTPDSYLHHTNIRGASYYSN